jgi:hypothetical protein
MIAINVAQSFVSLPSYTTQWSSDQKQILFVTYDSLVYATVRYNAKFFLLT